MRCAVRAASAQIEIKEGGWGSGSARYEGQVNQYGRAHGKGVDSYSDERYVGEWSEDWFHGQH